MEQSASSARQSAMGSRNTRDMHTTCASGMSLPSGQLPFLPAARRPRTSFDADGMIPLQT